MTWIATASHRSPRRPIRWIVPGISLTRGLRRLSHHRFSSRKGGVSSAPPGLGRPPVIGPQGAGRRLWARLLVPGVPATTVSDEWKIDTEEVYDAITITLNASADGLDGDELPISIEEVCDVPKDLATEAAQLAGGEGLALIGPGTHVFDAMGAELTGAAATAAVAEADSLTLRAQLKRPAEWGQDEDGAPVPTFETSRIDITD